MSNKQIHELPAVADLVAGDRILVSKAADDTTRQATLDQIPVQPSTAGAMSRPLARKISEFVSIKDFGATGDGETDDSAAINAALASDANTLFFPSGTYRITTSILVPPSKRLIGAGMHQTRIQSEYDGPAMMAQGGESLNLSIENMHIAMAADGSGIMVRGNDVSLEHLFFSGGSSAEWAIDMVDSNVVHMIHVQMGGFGEMHMGANGVRWRNSDPANNRVNYGDAVIQHLDIKLGEPNTIGLCLKGEQGNLINNVLVSKSQITASENGLQPYPGTTAIRLDSCARVTLLSVDMEVIEVGVHETGLTGQGAAVGNQYVGVYALNVGTAYIDSNDVATRSVQQRTFIGCDNFPDTEGLNDGDTILPAGLWLQSFVTGANAVRLRSYSEGEMVVDDGAEKGSVAFRVGGSSPQIAPVEDNQLVRLYLGKNSSASNPTMRDVTIQPVLRLEPRDNQNAAPTDGQIAYADGSGWNPGHGPGFYMREGGQWRKVAFVS